MRSVWKYLTAALAITALDSHGYPAPDAVSYTNIEQARYELSHNGITREQRRSHIPGVSELLYRGIIPVGYEIPLDTQSANKPLEKLRGVIPNVVFGREKAGDGLEDAWRMYLGLPQEHNTFGVSDYRPARGEDNKYYYKIIPYIRGLRQSEEAEKEGLRDEVTEFDEAEFPVTLKGIVKAIDKAGGRFVFEAIYPLTYGEGEIDTSIMWCYTLSRGEDEKGPYISYYDSWDLEGSIEGEEGILGKPFEIYDRIHYNPDTYEIIETESD